jgi:hypothetical protein
MNDHELRRLLEEDRQEEKLVFEAKEAVDILSPASRRGLYRWLEERLLVDVYRTRVGFPAGAASRQKNTDAKKARKFMPTRKKGAATNALRGQTLTQVIQGSPRSLLNFG